MLPRSANTLASLRTPNVNYRGVYRGVYRDKADDCGSPNPSST